MFANLKDGTNGKSHAMSCHVACVMSCRVTLCHVHAVLDEEPTASVIDFSMPTLRELLPGWMPSAYQHVQTTDAVMQGWRKSGLLVAWDEAKRTAALRHHAAHPLFKQGFTYTVPAADEPALDAVMSACSIADDDEEEFAEEEGEEGEEEEHKQVMEQLEQCQMEEESAADALTSIAMTREKRAAKPSRRFHDEA